MYTETNLFFSIPLMISFFTCNVFEVTASMVNNAATRVTDENFDEYFIFRICPVSPKLANHPQTQWRTTLLWLCPLSLCDQLFD